MFGFIFIFQPLFHVWAHFRVTLSFSVLATKHKNEAKPKNEAET